MDRYILPNIKQYKNIDDLFESTDKSNTTRFTDKSSFLGTIIKTHHLCIVGEPGIGKSRLLKELESSLSSKDVVKCNAVDFISKLIGTDVKYCIVDALDEVESNQFSRVFREIKDFCENNKNTNVVFSCRKHYVASYAHIFSSFTDLSYIELLRLENESVRDILSSCSKQVISNIEKSKKMLGLLSVPRYLEYFIEYQKENVDCKNIGQIFEQFVEKNILNAIEKYDNTQCDKNNLAILIQRVLEKIAFVMEIGRLDSITKDELYTILDGISGNMTQMVLSNLSLLFFENRILKEVNDVLMFPDTEIQEYLAAKELCRQDYIESVLYEIAVSHDVKHIYSNWLDVIPHVSYTRSSSFFNIFKLILSYESNLELDSLDALLRYVDPTILFIEQKTELFKIICNNYFNRPVYIRWRSPILSILQQCYSAGCCQVIMPKTEHLNKIQLSNISAILEVLNEGNCLSAEVISYWAKAANKLVENQDSEKQYFSLSIFEAIKDFGDLIRLADKFDTFNSKVKGKYCDITGYNEFTDKNVIQCWISDCYQKNPHAINAILCIKNPEIIITTYKQIVNDNQIEKFFDPEGDLSVHYFLLVKQILAVFNNNKETKNDLIKLFIVYLKTRHYHKISGDESRLFKQIIQDDSVSLGFVQSLDQNRELWYYLKSIEPEYIDYDLICAIENILVKLCKDNYGIDRCLLTLLSKIRHDQEKQLSLSKYLARYSDVFKRWDKSEGEENTPNNDKELEEAYNYLVDQNIKSKDKYYWALILCENIDYLKSIDYDKVFTVIFDFFNNVDLDKTKTKKEDQHSYNLSWDLIYIPHFVNAVCELGQEEKLMQYRMILAKTLPLTRRVGNIDSHTICSFYKKIIGKLSTEENAILSDWWKSRNDDFLRISPDDIMECITEYGMDFLSYKLEEYVNTFIAEQSQENAYVASKALELIAKGYVKWSVEDYRKLFDSIEKCGIKGMKMQCNAIMIENFHDEKAISWRFSYLKNNIVPTRQFESHHVRLVSDEEQEISGTNPRMFRCFMSVQEESVIQNMLELFEFGLSLSPRIVTREYSSYLMSQIYMYFINMKKLNYIQKLRILVEKHCEGVADNNAYNIMNHYELVFLNSERGSIDASVKKYNACIANAYLPIRNDADFRNYFTTIALEVQKEIQDQGIYSLVNSQALSEDFIQRELKNTIINKCSQLGLTNVRVDREVALQDNKRTDFLIWYGMCNPIMIELKLLHNKEIQRTKERHAYKMKFEQYSKATNACLSVFWVFDVGRGGNQNVFEDLKAEYLGLPYTTCLLTKCKCSSGRDTGAIVKKQIGKRTTRKKRK